MSKPIRFLGFAVLTWAAVRAVSLGIVPGMEELAIDAQARQAARPRIPPIQPTALPPIEPVAIPSAPQFAMGYGSHPAYPAYGPYPAYAPYPVYIPAPGSGGRSPPPQIIYVNPPQPAEPREVHVYGAGLPPSAEPEKLAMAIPAPQRQSTPSFEKPPRLEGLNRLSMSAWGTMRYKAGSDSLANAGTLGGSQAGARVLWKYSPELALSVRASAPVNSTRGAEGAVGIRYQPFASLPVAMTLERRHRFRDYGQSAFALFAEGGVYGRPMPFQSTLDGYFQGGVVDFNDPDWFVDGQLAVTRPIWRNLSGGVGVWGGAQPGLNRFDAGPRLSLRLTPKIRAHFDYRYKVAGNAQPGSGAVMTLAGDF